MHYLRWIPPFHQEQWRTNKNMETHKMIALVKEEHWYGMDEWWTSFIKCPKCNSLITSRSKFCSNCGVKLYKSKEIKELIKNPK